MVNSGYIAFNIETGGGFDTEGNIIPATKVPTAFIPCNLQTVTKRYGTTIDGQFLQASYKVLIDYNKLTAFDLSNVTEVQLKAVDAEFLGVFQIQNKERLNLSKLLKIVV